jgi:lipopolysaccharide transport system permease protein
VNALDADRLVTVRRPGHRQGFAADLRALAGHFDLFWTLTAHRIRVRYKQSVLGVCWALLQPVGLMLIFTLVFGRIARVPSEGVPYSLFAYSGLLLWSFFATAVGSATHALVAHGQLITKVYFPREILPLTYVAAALFDMCIGSTVLGALLLYHGRVPGWSIVFAFPAVATAVALVTAAALLLSALQVRFRDIGLAVPLLLYLWMFSTPIAYPLSGVPAAYRPWFMLNPMTGLVESFRRAVVHGTAPDLRMFGVPLLMTAVLLPVAYLVFKRVEATMADVI